MKNRRTRRSQRGLSIIGLIFIGLIVVGLLAIGFKAVPAGVEDIAIERALQKIRNEGTTVQQIQEAFDRDARIDESASINWKDLDITKEGAQVVISYAYQKKIPIVENVSLVIDFAGT